MVLNYKKCPIAVYSRPADDDSYQREIDAEQLVELAKSAKGSLRLTFSPPSGQFDRFQFDFRPDWDLFGESLKKGVSSTKVRSCHFHAINAGTREHSTLNACNPKDISGLIRIKGRQYVLGHSGTNFHLLMEGSRSCELSLPREKRASGKEAARLPNYYTEYVDGIKRWVELVFIADNTIYKKFGNDEARVHDHLHSIAGTLNSLYSPLNIRITLVWADVWKGENPIEVTEEADKTLRDFLAYRKTLLTEHSHDNAHLLTDVRFGSVIGKAYKGTMCSYDYSGGVIVDHSENPVFVGMTVAHEMGHNFGMDHDVEQCNCPVDSCIMAPASSTQNVTSYFSDCSLDTLSSALRRGVDYCLHNVPKMAFGGAKCGNGILEDGEDCDCGSTTSCPNKCCIAAECKLAKEAECADGDCCDLGECKLKTMATVCRQSINGCDLPEFCDGKNPSCPADFFVQDGHRCPNDLAEDYCYQGICGSRKQQCKFIWGPSAENSVRECYAFNEYGSFSGNCGYNQTNEQYLRCKPSDVLCGRLQCVHDSDKPVFGDPSTVYSAYNYVRNGQGKDETCRVVRTTLTGTGNRKADPGMVPDGATCGNDRICVNSSCRNKTEVLQMVSRCEPESCNDKGICNNVGNCHCVNGYGGVGCDLPGYGGSVNSGPANDKVFNPGLTLLYLLIFLVLIFSVASIYCRRKKGFWIHKKIWSKARVAFELRSFNMVPTRRAPPPPGTQIRHAHRQSWNAVWDEQPATSVQGEILHIDATKPYILGGAKAVLKQVKTAEKPTRQPNGTGFGADSNNPAKRVSASVSYSIQAKPTQPASIWTNKGGEEQRALVMPGGYDTGKSSSSDESDRHQIKKEAPPPAVPPHRNVNKKAPPPLPTKAGAPPKKPTTTIATAENDDKCDGNSKVDVKALTARFEQR